MAQNVVDSGDPVLNDILGGGYPEGRSTLVIGGPGVGKTTLAMQFIQGGLASGDQCLFISTEQTRDELADTLDTFSFVIDHPNLDIVTLNAYRGTPTETIQDGTVSHRHAQAKEEEYILASLEGDSFVDEHQIAFTRENVRQYLQMAGRDADRVVLDSASGLATMTDDFESFRRGIMDLIRLFSDDFGATSVLTAESYRTGSGSGGFGEDVSGVYGHDILKYTTHGVISLWNQAKAGETHHFLRVEKMRGTGHDKRTFELGFRKDGVHVVPRLRTRPGELGTHERMSTGIESLDTVLGGGFIKGALNVLQTDGRVSTTPILLNAEIQALKEGCAVAVALPAEFAADRFLDQLAPHVGDIDVLLDEDRLFFIEPMHDSAPIHDNHFVIPRTDRPLKEVYDAIHRRAGDRPLLMIIHLVPLVEATGEATVRDARYWAQANLVNDSDVVLYQFNPKLLNSGLVEFYRDTARLAIENYIDDNGLQYLKLGKVPEGYLGSERVVEYLEDPPYVRFQLP